MSLENDKVAEAEPVISVEGNMCGTVMRGAVAPPGWKTTSRRIGCVSSGCRPGSVRLLSHWSYRLISCNDFAPAKPTA